MEGSALKSNTFSVRKTVQAVAMRDSGHVAVRDACSCDMYGVRLPFMRERRRMEMYRRC